MSIRGTRPRSSRNPPKRVDASEASLRGTDRGLYTRQDVQAIFDDYAIPLLARGLGAKDFTVHGLRGKFGSVSRETVCQEGDIATIYGVEVTREQADTDSKKNIARLCLEAHIAKNRVMGEEELIKEWPLIEASGLGSVLLTKAADQIGVIDDTSEEIDFDDPIINRDIALGQLKMLRKSRKNNDQGPHILFGCSVSATSSKRLTLVPNHRPWVQFAQGYTFDSDFYDALDEETEIEEGEEVLIGNSPEEIQEFAWLGDELYRQVDDSLMREFFEAFEIVGMLKNRR